MNYCTNNKMNLNWIYKVFKDIAWINGQRFFDKWNKGKCVNPQKVDEWRNRQKIEGLRFVPDIFLDKLEAKHYAISNCKTYGSIFERFMNTHKTQKLRDIDEREISEHLKYLVIDGKSDRYINQMINAIKFYYEIILGMPNRFYTANRHRKMSTLAKVLSIEEIGHVIESTNNIKHRHILFLL